VVYVPVDDVEHAVIPVMFLLKVFL